MIHLSQLHRLLHITTIFVRHGLDEFVITLHLFRPYRWLLYLHPERWRRDNNKPRAIRLREALEELGPVFIKFGQALSTRPDLLPDDIAFELTRLQDKVPPFPGEEAEAIIARAYEASIDAHFQRFDSSLSLPLQLHRFTMPLCMMILKLWSRYFVPELR